MNGIKGRTNTESNYRAVYLDSSSSLKEFSLDRKKYFKKYIANEDVKDDDNKASAMGRLVETLLMESHLFDEKFYMSSCVAEPTGNMLAFVEALYKYTKQATNEEGEVTRKFEEISVDAYNDSGYKIPYERVMKGTEKTQGFFNSDAEIYYNEIRIVRPNNLTVVNTQDVENAERIVNELKTNEFIAPIVNLVDSSRWEIKNQWQIESYTVEGHMFKSMIDKGIIDHDNKVIWIYDLKCTWAVENFFDEYYLYRRAYIQGYLYWRAVKTLTEEGGVYEGYQVMHPRFIVCDSTNYYMPLIYTMSTKDITDAEEGFEHKGRRYPGVINLIKDLNWALKENIWNISRENYLNNGIVNLTN